MIRTIFRRIIYVILLVWIVTIISFWLSKQVPGDEVMDYISIDERSHSSFNPVEHRRAYERVARSRGLDLPDFYFTVLPGFMHDSVQFILPKDDKNVVQHWAYLSEDGKSALDLYKQLRNGLFLTCGKPNISVVYQKLCQFYNQSLSQQDVSIIKSDAVLLNEEFKVNHPDEIVAISQLNSVIETSHSLTEGSYSNSIIKLIPKIKWNGTRNQYHQWIAGLVYQKPMTSLVDGRNAWSKIYDAMKWTLLLNGFAFLISIVLGIFIGIWSGKHDGRTKEKVLNWILFALFAVPSFWLATLFIYFLSSGEWLSVFPTGGLGNYIRAESVVERWVVLSSHLFLPVMCLALGALAYVSRQMKESILHEYRQPYVMTLRAQGVSEKTILRKHIIGNALFPIITIIGGAIPALLSGSLIIEVIFSIPGMGRLMYSSLLSRDWPVAFPILIFVAAITILSYIITDIVYKWVDPRVKVIES